MPIRIISPAANQIISANTFPHTVRVTAVADSNINTDVRFKLNGTIVGIDTSATTATVNGVAEYRYSFNVPVPTAGIYSIEVEDIHPGNVPVTVRSTAQVGFEVKLTAPVVTLSQAKPLNMVTATIANRPPGSFVRFILNGKIIKEDTTSPFNVSVPESGEVKAELVVGNTVVQTGSLVVNVSPAPTPTPTPIPIAGPKGDKGDTGTQGLRGENGLQGERGFTGATGATGIPGQKGDKGDKGDAGIAGAAGEKGAAGDRGISGLPGSKGDTGAQGIQGIPGLKGDKGDIGGQGIQGIPGINWRGFWSPTQNYAIRDAVSYNGSSYFAIADSLNSPPPSANWNLIAQQGAQGERGPIGSSGSKGDIGIQGIQGNPGPAGATGATGAAGTANWPATWTTIPLISGMTGNLRIRRSGDLAQLVGTVMFKKPNHSFGLQVATVPVNFAPANSVMTPITTIVPAPTGGKTYTSYLTYTAASNGQIAIQPAIDIPTDADVQYHINTLFAI